MKDPLSRWEEEEEKPPLLPRILGALFHWFMVGLGLSIVFAIGGSLLFLRSNKTASVALQETPASAIIRFCIGGSIAVGLLLYCYFRKKRDVI